MEKPRETSNTNNNEVTTPLIETAHDHMMDHAMDSSMEKDNMDHHQMDYEIHEMEHSMDPMHHSMEHKMDPMHHKMDSEGTIGAQSFTSLMTDLYQGINRGHWYINPNEKD